MVPTNHPFRREKWSEPNLHEDMFQPLIFKGVTYHTTRNELCGSGLLVAFWSFRASPGGSFWAHHPSRQPEIRTATFSNHWESLIISTWCYIYIYIYISIFCIYIYTWNPNDPCFDWKIAQILAGGTHQDLILTRNVIQPKMEIIRKYRWI